MTKYKGICLSSGGVNGVVQLGVLHEMFMNDELDELSYFSGCSIGSIICFLLAIGYTPIEILTHSCDKKFASQVTHINVMNIPSMYGLYPISIITDKLKELALVKLGYNPSFKDLLLLGKNLIITTYCLGSSNGDPIPDDEKYLFISADNFPDMKIIDAIAMSSAIPIIFQQVIYEGRIYIDGCCNTNFPIYELEYIVPIGEPIIGITIKYKENDLSTLFGYINALLNISLTANDISRVSSRTRVIELPIMHANYMLSITTTQKIKMFIDGSRHYKQLNTTTLSNKML